MFRRSTVRFVVLAVAGLGLLLVARAFLSRTSLLASAATAQGTNQPVIRFVKNPEMAPALQATDLLGKPVNMDHWVGKVVLVNFWATWCPPCREEIPELLELKKEFKDRLEIVGISEDDDPPASVLKFAERREVTYPIVMATQEMIDAYGGVPANYAPHRSWDPRYTGKEVVVQKHSGLYPIRAYELEIRSLLGLPTDARVETFADTGQVFLKNAANATELPGVSFKGLTAEQKKQALHRLTRAESVHVRILVNLTLSPCRV